MKTSLKSTLLNKKIKTLINSLDQKIAQMYKKLNSKNFPKIGTKIPLADERNFLAYSQMIQYIYKITL